MSLKVIDNLKQDTKRSKKRLLYAYIQAKKLLEEFEHIEKLELTNPKEVKLKKAKSALRWMGKMGKRFTRRAKSTIEDLRIVPKLGVSQKIADYSLNLAARLEDEWQKFIGIVSQYGEAKVNKEFNELKKDEKKLLEILDKKHPNGSEEAAMKQIVSGLITRLEADVKNLIAWIQGTQVTLKQIEDFEESLEKESEVEFDLAA
jgi:phage tail tape-measure protein